MDTLILIKAFILGIVEGATEFLPVSSTGHLIIAGDLLNFNDAKGEVFEVVIQLGSILAVCWAFRQRLFDTAMHMTTNVNKSLIRNLFIAFMPAAIIGLMFHHQIKTYLFSPISVAIALILGGLAILLIEKNVPEVQTFEVDKISSKQALQVGLSQCLALVPGVSRSGATILGGVIFGLNRQTATEFSFLLAIPIMFAATGFDLLKSWKLLAMADFPMFAVGFVTAFISALFVVKFLLRYVANHDFRGFAWYRIVFGLLILFYFLNK